jgi:hypothetical protein
VGFIEVKVEPYNLVVAIQIEAWEMTTMLLAKDEISSLKPSHFKQYRNALKLVYSNPEFKAAYRYESGDKVLKMLSCIEIISKKGEEILSEDTDITKQFINDNIGSVRKLSLLPAELQPSREAIETIAKISLTLI